MMVLSVFMFSLLGIYALIIFWQAGGFVKTPYFKGDERNTATPLSLIICARNEEKNIGLCLKSILLQEYDFTKVQLILVDDASDDTTLTIAEALLSKSNLNYRIITQPKQAGKKASIASAIALSEHELLVMRDADTFTLSKLWLKGISDFYSQHPSDLIIAPVAIADYQGLLWALQCIENNVLSVMASGSAYYHRAFLCSGANLIYTKTIFEKTKGFASHQHISSGDDVLFLEDVKKIKGSRINYLKSKEALVYTYPSFSFQSLLSQKIRWASKFKTNSNPLNYSFAFITFTINLVWLVCFITYFAIQHLNHFHLIFLLVKLAIDILLLFLASSFIKNRSLLWYALPVALIYPLYTIMVSIGTLFFKPKWK